jgi:hypothetical protein
MSWGQITAEDLKKVGVDPDKLTALETKLNAAATKEDVEAVKSGFQEIKDSIAALTNKVNLASSNENQGNNNNNRGSNSGNGDENRGSNTPPDPYAIDPVAFMENPAENIKRMVQASVSGVQIHSLTIAADVAYNNAKNTLKYFNVFEDEIKKEWDKYTVVQKANPSALIENIYNLVKGRHLDEIMTDVNKKEGKYNIIQSGGTSVINTNTGRTDDKKEPLTNEELAAARKFGMSEDEWRASKGGLKYVG